MMLIALPLWSTWQRILLRMYILKSYYFLLFTQLSRNTKSNSLGKEFRFWMEKKRSNYEWNTNAIKCSFHSILYSFCSFHSNLFVILFNQNHSVVIQFIQFQSSCLQHDPFGHRPHNSFTHWCTKHLQYGLQMSQLEQI